MAGTQISALQMTEAVLTASRALVAVAARSLATAAATEVTLPQYRALVVLAAKGPLRVGELAEALGIHPSTATRLCDRFVERKLVRRAVDRSNRRETTISLSAKAGRRWSTTSPTCGGPRSGRSSARIPVELREPAVAALVAFAEAAGEPAQEAWTLGWT